MNPKTLPYQKYCKHCKYMKSHPGYAQRVLGSQYFDSQSTETFPQVFGFFKPPMNVQTAYTCMKKHFAQFQKEVSITHEGEIVVDKRRKSLGAVLEEHGSSNHDIGLDEFIELGRQMVKDGRINITGQTYLQAIKIKKDDEKGNKDREADMIKAFFAGKPNDKTD